MPFLAIPAVLIAVNAAIGAGVVATTIAIAISVAIVAAVSIGMTMITKAIMGSPSGKSQSAAQKSAQTVRIAIAARRVIYGEIRVGGIITYMDTKDIFNFFINKPDSFLRILITLSSHVVQEIGAIYFNDRLVPLRTDQPQFAERLGVGWVSGSLGVWTSNGTEAQDTNLNNVMGNVLGRAAWPVSFRQDGCAKMFLSIRHNPNIFPGGIPNITCIVKGALLYDPRDQQVRYSKNPALVVRDYLTNTIYGLGDAVINDVLCSTSANVCDESVAISGRGATFTVIRLAPPATAPQAQGSFAPIARLPTINVWPIGQRNKTFSYAITYLDGTGETTASPLRTLLITGAPLGGVQITFSRGGINTTQRKIYRTVGNGSQLKLLTTINDNTTTTYGDQKTDASLGANVPVTNTTKVQDDIRVNTQNDMSMLVTGGSVSITTTGTLPAPLTATTYYVIRSINATFWLATTKANALAGINLDLTTEGSGVHTIATSSEVRYECDGSLDTDIQPREAIAALLTSMVGKAIHQGGVWNIYSGSYFAPTVELTVDDLDGEIDGTFLQSRRDSFNGVKGIYINKLDFYQPTDFPVVTNATYLSEDQDVRTWQDLDLGFTISGSSAQRMAKIELEKSRQAIVIKLKCKITAFRLQAGEVFNLTYDKWGWSSKPFEILEWRLTVRQGDAPAIGVDILARETASEIYDWNVGEETFVDFAPNTDLPDPFLIAAPTNLVITESVYETTGSAGVKSRATITWEGDAGLVRTYQLEYKNANETIFTIKANITGLTTIIDDLETGYYDFRILAVSNLNVESEYSIIVRKEMVGLAAQPATITNFTVVKNGGFGFAKWDLHPELDVRVGGHILIRHTSKLSGAVWEDGRELTSALGNSNSSNVPLITGTYMARALDSTGNIGIAPALFVATEGLVTGFTIDFTSTQATGFTGVKTNITAAASKINITDTSSALLGTYEFDEGGGLNYIDMTDVKTRRFESDIDQLQFADDDLIDARANVDTWANIDGDKVDDGQIILYASITDDDPASSPTWSPWMPFAVTEFTCRAVKFKLELIAGSEQNNIEVSLLTVHISTPT